MDCRSSAKGFHSEPRVSHDLVRHLKIFFSRSSDLSFGFTVKNGRLEINSENSSDHDLLLVLSELKDNVSDSINPNLGTISATQPQILELTRQRQQRVVGGKVQRACVDGGSKECG